VQQHGSDGCCWHEFSNFGGPDLDVIESSNFGRSGLGMIDFSDFGGIGIGLIEFLVFRGIFGIATSGLALIEFSGFW
jgi:hypothetical protein